MIEYYIRRLLAKILSWFLPRKAWRLRLQALFGFGKRVILLEHVNHFVPSEILAYIESNAPLSFMQSYKLAFAKSRATRERERERILRVS